MSALATGGGFSEDDSSTGTLSISKPPEGEFFEFSATIENTGETIGTHVVKIEASIASDAQEVEIASGESTAISFTDIDTGRFPTGEHLLAIYTPQYSMTGTLTIEAVDDKL